MGDPALAITEALEAGTSLDEFLATEVPGNPGRTWADVFSTQKNDVNGITVPAEDIDDYAGALYGDGNDEMVKAFWRQLAPYATVQELQALGTDDGMVEGATVRRVASGNAYRCATAAASTSTWEPCSGSINARDYGFTPSATSAVNKAALQAMIDDASSLGYGTIAIPAGTYTLDSIVYLKPGITILGYGATLFRPAGLGDFDRMLTTQASTWQSADDSPLLTIKGLTLDGNRANQGTYTGYELEHQSLIFLMCGSSSTKGRLRVLLEDITFAESAGDGVNHYINTDVKVVNCHAWNCFRGGFTISGGWSKFQYLNCSAYGDANHAGWQSEPTASGGYNGTGQPQRIDGVVVGLEVGTFDAAFNSTTPGGGGTLLCSGVKVLDGPCAFYGATGVMRFADSDFVIGDIGASNTNRINRPNDMRFDACSFRMDPNATDVRLAWVVWNSSSSDEDQRLAMNSCKFYSDASVSGVKHGVYSAIEDITRNNMLELNDCDFYGDFDDAIGVYRSHVRIHNALIEGANNGVYMEGTSTLPFIVEMDNVKTRNCTTRMNIASSHANNTLYDLNSVIMDADSAFLSSAGFASIKHGRPRILTATNPTTTSTPGLVGDIREMTPPPTSGAYRWICTVSSITAATWRVLESVASPPDLGFRVVAQAAVTLAASDRTIHLTRTSGTIAVTMTVLPAGYKIRVLATSLAGGATVTLACTRGGASGTVTLAANDDGVDIVSDGSGWIAELLLDGAAFA